MANRQWSMAHCSRLMLTGLTVNGDSLTVDRKPFVVGGDVVRCADVRLMAGGTYLVSRVFHPPNPTYCMLV